MIESEYIQAALLGIVQGIAEFLPVSSSGHVILFSSIMQSATGKTVSPDASLQMNVALHLGTLLSILVVYRKDLVKILSQPRAMAMIVLATIPIVIVGFTLKDWIEANLQSTLVAGCGLIVTAIMLFTGQKLESNKHDGHDISPTMAIVVGVFQAIAIVPGISRSGSTISSGMALGMKRETAAQFSFFIAIPAIAGAVILTMKDVVEGNATGQNVLPLLVGAGVSFLVGWASLKLLLRMITQRRLHLFAGYCFVIGLVAIGCSLFL